MVWAAIGKRAVEHWIRLFLWVEERCYFVGYRWEVEVDLLHGGRHPSILYPGDIVKLKKKY
jgi:hypothetical protein